MNPIPLTGTGGLFTRIGVLGGLASAVNVDRGTTVPSHVSEIQQQFLSSNQDVIDNLYTYLLSYQNAGSGIMSNLKAMAANTVVEMANRSVPQPSATTSYAISLLIAQMKAAGQTVNACNVSASLTPYPTNVGNAVGVISCKDQNGSNTEYQFSELLTATVTNDYQGSSSLLGIEPISVVAPASVSDAFSWLYPAGSGVSLSLSAVSALKNGGSGVANWLQNGAMESYAISANLPDYWHLGAGTPGSTIFQVTANPYDGLSCVSFSGNGSENTAIHQSFSIAGTSYDTNAIIYPNAQFAVNLAIKMSSTPPSGVLRIALANASGPCSDNGGNANLLSINLDGVGTSWQLFQAVFRTPNRLPTPPIFLELKLATPLPAGYSLYIDHVSFCQMARLYAGGPSVAIFSGNTPLVRGDSLSINVFNNYGGKMQYLFDKLFGMKSLSLILPSGGTPTIPDSLIQ